MRHDKRIAPAARPSSNNFWAGMLAPRAVEAIERSGVNSLVLERANEAEACALLAQARNGLDLADELAVRRMVAKNPDVIQLTREAPGQPANGLFAYLPLNDFGAAMLVRGEFDGASPDPAWITRAGETPAAIYVWLFFGPGQYMRALPAIGALFQAIAPEGCTVFTRGATELSERMHLKMGYVRANAYYPGAPEWLIVAFPESGRHIAAPEAGTRIEIRQVRSFEELSHVFAIRSATYIAEQFPLHAEEFDGNDFCATHFVGYINGDPAGAIRARYFADFVKLERLAVKLEYRKSRLAFQLCHAAAAHVRRKGFTRIYGHASDDIAPFWRLLGGRPMADRPKFRFANIEYREMAMEFEPDPLAVTFGAPPMMTIRPEGLWDEPGPLDYSNLASDPLRTQLMQAHSREARK